ncbi:monoamine oxidase [Streptomyces phaeochromogenes]|jgi:hypothetical protein|uniref:hypothetical protein n=1 Tax=Streptomyces phaeochromogenes TaxID=1923 RepID=UPI00278E8889|nr:hypothetical protein [Streptomyces phaeochromogenes]MDQ0948735.1 monoamine oxidase [Streptomyces phaeochromogenes]
MSKRTRAASLTTFVAASVAFGAVLAGPADATGKDTGASKHASTSASGKAKAWPKFLSASQLPPHPTSSWTAGKVTDGVPDELRFCIEDTLPGYDSRYRDFRTDLETNAQQLTFVVGSSAKAKALATRLNKDIRACATRIEQSDPETEAALKDYGKLSVEEGAHAYGLHTETSWGATDINLYSVGRDGKAVTLVRWGQMGDFSDAPVKAFKKTTTTAVNKLY